MLSWGLFFGAFVDSPFPISMLNINVESWVALVNEPFILYYNKQSQEFKNIPDDERPAKEYKKLSANQVVDISHHFRPLMTPKQKQAVGIDLAYLGFVQQARYEGLIGKICAFFAKVFNWIFRGCFATAADRCKTLAQDLLGLSSMLDNKGSKKEFIGALKAYRRIYEVNSDPKIYFLNECLGRWLVSKKSLHHVIKKVNHLETTAAQ